MHKIIVGLCLGLFLILTQTQCKKNNGQIPSYIHLDSFILTTDIASQGAPTSDFKDAWVYVDNILIGTFELPVTIPVLKTGKVDILIVPGIIENGINSIRKTIDIYKPVSIEHDLAEKRIDTIPLNISLRDNATIAWKEDFEDLSISLKYSVYNNTNDSILIIGPNDPRGHPQSKYTGLLSMPITDSVRTTEFESLNKFTMPNLGKNVYFEIDLKTNADLQIGIYKIAASGASQRIPYLIIRNTENKWKKIYVNFNQEIGNIAPSVRETIFFEHTSDKIPEVKPTFYLDNLKLIYLE